MRIAFLATLLHCVVISSASAVTLGELRADPKLTPQKLMGYFAQFKYKLRSTVQTPEAFLASETGDCDDFATLAAMLLKEKGYSTHLVAVFMEHDIHVVCYVEESKAYLDFNNRKKAEPLVVTSGALPDIAQKVAASFHASWMSVMEYKSKNGGRETVRLDFPQN
jgi:hypothetical protein